MMTGLQRLWGLYVIAFLNGAVLMAFEILGSRVLAPSFGNTIFVWGSLIGVFMGGMAAGYFFGGWLGDRFPKRDWLWIVLLLAGAYLLVFPLFAFDFTRWLADLGLGPRLGPFLSSGVLFFVPNIFMGAVSPLVFVLALKDLQSAGRKAGNLYALSTMGSIAGTLGTAFFFVMWLGTRASLYSLGGVMILLALGAFFLLKAEERTMASGGRPNEK